MKFNPHSTPVQFCPYCDAEIASQQVNITEGVAQCGSCGTLSRLSELNYSGATVEETLSLPPAQVSIQPGYERMEIIISLFSIPKFLGSLLATLFWNGIVSIFLSLAAAAVYYQINGPIPEWFPTPGLEKGKPIMNGEVMGMGMTISLCLFLTPFVIIGTGMIINTLLRLCGSTRVVIDPTHSYISTGILFLRFKSSFDPYHVRSIGTAVNKISQEGQTSFHIALESTKTIRFGRLLSVKQQDWLVTLLKQVFLHRNPAKPSPLIPPMSWLDQLR
jgi:hypothetical protein